MSSYEQLLASGREYLRRKQVPEADLDAWYLLEHIIGKDRSWYLLNGKEEATSDETSRYEILLKQRGQRIPLQQLMGKTWFMGLEFLVNDKVLIPRQDTETLVEEGIKRLKKGASILDICTGTGCILLSLLYNGDKCTGTGVDISSDALKIAEENGKALGIDAKFVESDMLEQVEGMFDMIVSNPPYIPTGDMEELMPEVRDHEPHLALDGGEDGLDFYRKIIKQTPEYLQKDGWLLVEIGCEQGVAVKELFCEQEFEEISIVKDLAGLDRVVLGRKK